MLTRCKNHPSYFKLFTELDLTAGPNVYGPLSKNIFMHIMFREALN